MSVTAWRIVKTKHAGTAFSGEGARLNGGRWNLKGSPVVYLAGSQSLAILEMLVHLPSEEVGAHYTLFRVEIPDDLIETIPPDQLPAGCAADPVPAPVPAFGSEWAASGRSCVLRVPSAVAGEEFNYLANPLHPRFGDIRVGPPVVFRFDSRLA